MLAHIIIAVIQLSEDTLEEWNLWNEINFELAKMFEGKKKKKKKLLLLANCQKRFILASKLSRWVIAIELGNYLNLQVMNFNLTMKNKWLDWFFFYYYLFYIRKENRNT